MDDNNLLKIIQRTYNNIPCNSKSERAAVTARIFDVEKEINLTENGAYREADIISKIYSSVKEKERRMLAKSSNDNLEMIVDDTESGKLEIISGLAKDSLETSLNTSYKMLRPFLFGALPRHVQYNLAKKYNEKLTDYIRKNLIAESAIGVGLIGYMMSIAYSKDHFLIFLVSGSLLSINAIARSMYSKGSLPVSIAYHLFISPIKYAQNKYQEKKKELKEKKMAKKAIELEQSETKQLPSPEVKATLNIGLVEELLGRELNKEELTPELLEQKNYWDNKFGKFKKK